MCIRDRSSNDPNDPNDPNEPNNADCGASDASDASDLSDLSELANGEAANADERGHVSDTDSDSERSSSPMPLEQEPVAPSESATTAAGRAAVPYVQVGTWDGLDALLAGRDTSRVSYLDYTRAMTNESFFYFRGKGSGNDMAVHTHMETRLLRYALDNLEDIFNNVPYGTANFNFTPEQMFFIGWNRIVNFPFDIKFKIRRLDVPFADRGSLSRSALSLIHI